MMPGMSEWVSLIPAAPEVAVVDGEPRLEAMRWHRAAVARGWPDYDPDPEIYRIAGEPLPWQPADLAWALSMLPHASVPYDGGPYHLPALIARQLPPGELAAFGPALRAV